VQIGNYTASRQAVQEFTAQHNLNFDSFIDQVVEDALNLINDTLKMMFTEWENEPIYKVWEVVHERSFQAEQIIGIGAAAPAIIPLLSEFMQLPYYLHAYSPVANALGACLARPTMTMNLHIDTAQNFYAIDYKGIRENTSFKWDWQLSDAQEFAQAQFLNIIKEMGIEDYQDESEFISSEQFNIIRSWERSGKIMDIGIQITPGLIKEFKGVEI
jgi:N-methylhydantoinase A